jgi:hypothetical protein
VQMAGIPLAAGGNGLGLSAADGTSALPLGILGLCLAWHGYLVYTGKVPVPRTRRAFLYRPDIDLSGLWCGLGLVLWGVGWSLSIPPFLPIDILGQIVAWTGAALFIFGIVAYIYLPVYLYLPERLRPAWARPTQSEAVDLAAANDGALRDEGHPMRSEAVDLSPMRSEAAEPSGDD